MFGGKTIVLDGELNLTIQEDGELNNITVVHDGAPVPPYQGRYVVDPRFYEQVLETKDLRMLDDVTVNSIEVARTTNPAGGTTVYIGGII